MAQQQNGFGGVNNPFGNQNRIGPFLRHKTTVLLQEAAGDIWLKLRSLNLIWPSNPPKDIPLEGFVHLGFVAVLTCISSYVPLDRF